MKKIKKIKNILSITLAVVLCFLAYNSFSNMAGKNIAYAEDETVAIENEYNGKGYQCDPWKLNDAGTVIGYQLDGVLYISGDGQVEKSYISCNLKKSRGATGLIFEEGVTGLGFPIVATQIKSLAIPKTLNYSSAISVVFKSFRNLEKIYYAGSEDEWNAVFSRAKSQLTPGVEIIYDVDISTLDFSSSNKENLRSPDNTGAQLFKLEGGMGGVKTAIQSGDILSPGDVVDFTNTFFSGTIIYYRDGKTDTQTSSDYEKGAQQQTVTGYTQWRVLSVDTDYANIKVCPVGTELGVYAEGTDATLKTGDIIPALNNIIFPTNGTIKYYASSIEPKPTFTANSDNTFKLTLLDTLQSESEDAEDQNIQQVSAWKVKSVDITNCVVELYPDGSNIGIHKKNNETFLKVGDTLNTGDIIDLSCSSNDGQISFYTKSSSNEYKLQYTLKGKEIEIISKDDFFMPRVTSWQISAINYYNGTMNVFAKSYERWFEANGVKLSNGMRINIFDKVTFPLAISEGKILYYSDADASEPFATEEVNGSGCYLRKTTETGQNLIAWRVKSFSAANKTISVYPDGLNSGHYTLINRANQYSDIYTSDLSIGGVLKTGDLVNASSFRFEYRLPLASGNKVLDDIKNDLHFVGVSGYEDVQYWKIVSYHKFSYSEEYMLEPLYDINPTFDLLHPGPKPGERENPWQVGDEGSDIKAYIEGSTLYLNGSGKMQDDCAKNFWKDREDVREIKIGNGITSLGRKAFYDLKNVTKVTIPNTVTYIGESAFSGCSSLQNITIPNSVEEIDRLAFYFCKKLISVKIGTGIKKIKDYAFYECPITSVTYDGTSEAWKKVEIGKDNDSIKNVKKYNNLTGSAIDESNPILLGGLCMVVVIAIAVAVLVSRKKRANKQC